MAKRGGDSRTTTATKAGRGSLSLHSVVGDSMWCACFLAAIAGVSAAQRAAPNPDLIVRFAAQIAERAVAECERHLT
jgi:hypothetical protein